MKTRSEIDIDFKAMMRQAERLEELASDMENLSKSSLDSTLQNIALNWKGENANLYLGKGDRLKGNIMTTARELKQIAENIKAKARYIYSKEMEALRIAQRRTY